MKKNKKCLSVLSTAAIGTLIATALTSGVFAKTTDIIVDMNGQNVKFNFEELNQSYEDKIMGDEAPLYDTFIKNQRVISLLDDKTGYVDYNAVKEAAEDAFLDSERFELDKFTENTKQILPEVKIEAEWKDGKIVSVQQGLKVESVEATNLTTVKVDFNQEIDKVEKENFKIEGKGIKAATLLDNKKSVELEVEKMEYATEYEIAIKDLKVNEKVQDEIKTTFKTKGVDELWKLEIEAPAALKSDGVDTGVVKFKLLDNKGNVDKNANDVVLDLNTTYGYLSQKRVTIQNGEAEVILRSEFVEGGVKSKIDAQIIEAKAGSEYKDLIGKVFSTASVEFNPEGEVQGGETVVIKSLVSVNSNEADRVVLTFDEEVGPSDFYTVNEQGTPVDKNTIKVTQKGDADGRGIEGYLFNSNSKKTVTVVLKKANTLKDNSDVYVEAKIGRGSSVTKSFKLADARTPNLTGVKTSGNNKTLLATFSEPISKANFIIDGRFVETDKADTPFKSEAGDLVWRDGKYVDERNQVVITLTDKYQEPDKDKAGDLIYSPGFFKQGKHSLQASNIYDFAAESGDLNNIGTTQSLGFNVVEDNTQVNVVQYVDSPEQFRVAFDKDVAFEGNKEFKDVVEFKVIDETGKAVNVDATYFDNAEAEVKFDDLLEVTDLGDNSYKIELKHDWTKIYNTAQTKDNYYNDKFVLVLPANSVKTAVNGKANEKEIILPLTELAGSALAKADTTSPTIANIEKSKEFNAVNKPNFIVTMTEPVKLYDKGDEAGTTLAQNQAELPQTKVEFLGKDKDGKVRTFTGEVIGYADKLNKKIEVKWNAINGETPQTIVDADGSTDWTIVVKSISDDVGNTAPTATKLFELEKSKVVNPPVVNKEFRVVPTAGTATGEDGKTETFNVIGKEEDTITIKFTEPVAVIGLGAATNVKNYTLNGKELPTGTSIVLDLTSDSGDTVVIKMNKGTLGESNVITLAKNLESKEGTKISKDLTFTFKVAKNGVNPPAGVKTDKELVDEAAAKVVDINNLKEEPTVDNVKAAVEAAVGVGIEVEVEEVKAGEYKVTLTKEKQTAEKTIKAAKKADDAVDTKAIDTAIEKANEAKKDVKESKDGTDVEKTAKWVTKEVKEALEAAITKANEAKGTVKSEQEVTAAAKELDNAVATYNKAKAEGTKADAPAKKSDEKEITKTTVGTLEGKVVKDVPTGTKVSALKAALTASDKATVEILDAKGGSAAADQDSTDVTAKMVIQVTAEDGTTAEYTIAIQ
ncbi:hypothetical protein [Clostridium tetani]|uniref:hypothetical protein n=1 Tax=Clostridium tetani TaxID=1513 RepID=UPI0013E9837B|nr:hypothetical protein [Clostridium tetani]